MLLKKQNMTFDRHIRTFRSHELLFNIYHYYLPLNFTFSQQHYLPLNFTFLQQHHLPLNFTFLLQCIKYVCLCIVMFRFLETNIGFGKIWTRVLWHAPLVASSSLYLLARSRRNSVQVCFYFLNKFGPPKGQQRLTITRR